MTIGIAAAGPNAGQAILAGLKAAEAVGRGALHGFVSLVAITPDARLARAETQNGGSPGLFGGASAPVAIATAARAGLMSSGPNRPEPLSQFTPADPRIGLVTGHRFPNVAGTNGRPLNGEVLARMGEGCSPEAAVRDVVAENDWADAGLIALSRDGRLHTRNTPILRRFGDAGEAIGELPDGSARAAVLHNAIEPHAALAALVLEVVLRVMMPPSSLGRPLSFRAGVPLQHGAKNSLLVDGSGQVLALTVRDVRYLTGRWSFGLGFRAPVVENGREIGRASYEPYLSLDGGQVESIDGRQMIDLPIDTVV